MDLIKQEPFILNACLDVDVQKRNNFGQLPAIWKVDVSQERAVVSLGFKEIPLALFV